MAGPGREQKDVRMKFFKEVRKVHEYSLYVKELSISLRVPVNAKVILTERNAQCTTI